MSTTPRSPAPTRTAEPLPHHPHRWLRRFRHADTTACPHHERPRPTELAPGYAAPASSAAAGRWPAGWRGRARPGHRRHAGLPGLRDHHLRRADILHRCRGDVRRVRAGLAPSGRRPSQGPTPSSSSGLVGAGRARVRRCRADHRPVAAAAAGRDPGPRAVPLVGLRHPRARRGRRPPGRAAPARQDPPPRRHQFRRAAQPGDDRGRRAPGLDAGAVFPARPARGGVAGRARRGTGHAAALLRTVAGGFLSARWLGRPEPASRWRTAAW
jgi:hypothetical protein